MFYQLNGRESVNRFIDNGAGWFIWGRSIFDEAWFYFE